MKLNKIIKMPVVSLCLGMIFSGISAFATENKDNQNNLENATQSQEILSKVDGNKEIEELIKKEVDTGKSETYAKEYARMIVKFNAKEEEARKCARVFENLIKKHRSEVYAEEYAILVAKFTNDREYSSMIKEFIEYEMDYKNFKSIGNSIWYVWLNHECGLWLDIWAKTVEREVNSGKSHAYAREYARLTFGCKLSESFARKYADVFDKEVKSGKSQVYATEYAGQPHEKVS